MEGFNLTLKINETSEEEKHIKDIYKLTLKKRKIEFKNELKNENLKLENLQYLLSLNNTNEDLLYRYMLTVKNENVINEMEKYSVI